MCRQPEAGVLPGAWGVTGTPDSSPAGWARSEKCASVLASSSLHEGAQRCLLRQSALQLTAQSAKLRAFVRRCSAKTGPEGARSAQIRVPSPLCPKAGQDRPSQRPEMPRSLAWYPPYDGYYPPVAGCRGPVSPGGRAGTCGRGRAHCVPYRRICHRTRRGHAPGWPKPGQEK
jgi:hypothetical protein